MGYFSRLDLSQQVHSEEPTRPVRGDAGVVGGVLTAVGGARVVGGIIVVPGARSAVCCFIRKAGVPFAGIIVDIIRRHYTLRVVYLYHIFSDIRSGIIVPISLRSDIIIPIIVPIIVPIVQSKQNEKEAYDKSETNTPSI